MEPNILATCARTQIQVLNKSGSLNAKRTFPWRASSSDVFTQAAQQPAPIPEVNALPFFTSPALELAPLTLTLFFFCERQKWKTPLLLLLPRIVAEGCCHVQVFRSLVC